MIANAVICNTEFYKSNKNSFKHMVIELVNLGVRLMTNAIYHIIQIAATCNYNKGKRYESHIIIMQAFALIKNRT